MSLKDNISGPPFYRQRRQGIDGDVCNRLVVGRPWSEELIAKDSGVDPWLSP